MNNVIYSKIKKTFSKTFILLKSLKENTNYKLVSNFVKFKTNPLIWEFLGIIFYWNKYCLKKLNIDIKLNDNYSFNDNRIKLEKKFFLSYEGIVSIEKKYHNILNILIDFLFQNNINFIDKKIILNSLFYNNKINERIIFTYFVINLKIRSLNYLKNNNNEQIIYINVPGGEFKQGNNKELCFDNEYPEFIVKIKNFTVSKHCITNYQYLKFVNHNGYKNNIYWDPEGWEYIKEKKISCPIFWKKIDDKWYEQNFGTTYELSMNHPVKNITYYEARAFCKFINCRLPTESEWEYLANNFNELILKDSNLDDKIGNTISVSKDKNINSFGIVGLFGNVWEWCNDFFYPYDGFRLDKIDRNRSIGSFGNKIVCRGGSFCTSSENLTKSQREYEDPINISKFIGFRVVKI